VIKGKWYHKNYERRTALKGSISGQAGERRSLAMDVNKKSQSNHRRKYFTHKEGKKVESMGNAKIPCKGGVGRLVAKEAVNHGNFHGSRGKLLSYQVKNTKVPPQ